MQGTFTTAGNYPSANGIQADGGDMLSGFTQKRLLASLTIWGAPAGAYILQALNEDSNGSQWLPIPASSLSGIGQVIVAFVGTAIRLVGTGTETGTVIYEIEILQEDQAAIAMPQYFV